MLVLTRKIGEGIVIGNDVKITVLETRGGTVRIGVDARKPGKFTVRKSTNGFANKTGRHCSGILWIWMPLSEA